MAENKIFEDAGAGAVTEERKGIAVEKDDSLRLEGSSASEPVGADFFCEKVDTYEKLLVRMGELRSRMEPFLNDYVKASDFDAACRSDPIVEGEFTYLDTGKVDFSELESFTGWEPVTIPDIRGPAGKWFGLYRFSFQLPEQLVQKERIYIRFEHVDYACEVYCNHVYVGGHVGFFAPFELDLTEAISRDPMRNQVLHVLIKNDASFLSQGDKVYAATGLGWDDPRDGWSHCPSGGGIGPTVCLIGSQAVHISDQFAFLRSEDSADIEYCIEVENHHPQTYALRDDKTISKTTIPVPKGRFRVELHPKNFIETGNQTGNPIESWELEAGSLYPGKNRFRFKLKDLVSRLRRWTFDQPYLYAFIVTLEDESGVVLSRHRHDTGFKTFFCDETSEPKGKYYFNGERIFLRGVNTMGATEWAHTLGDREQVIQDLLMYKAANMNFVRMTQRPVHPEIMDLFDALGLGLQVDLPLFGFVSYSKYEDVLSQSIEMENLTRGHPSVLLESLINEPNSTQQPSADSVSDKSDIGQKHLDLDELDTVLRMCRDIIRIQNPVRVVIAIEGVESFGYSLDRDAPFGPQIVHHYPLWYGPGTAPINGIYANHMYNTKPGWMAGCGEYGAEGLDSIETLIHGRWRHLRFPKDWVPESDQDTAWHPRLINGCQAGKSWETWHPPAKTAAEYVELSQAHQARAVRWMTRAFRVRADIMQSTTVHLGIDAFPANWVKSLISFNRVPKPAFFEYLEACEPVALALTINEQRIYAGRQLVAEAWLLNDKVDTINESVLEYGVMDGKRIRYHGSKHLDLPASASTYAGSMHWEIPAVLKRERWKVFARLLDKSGTILADVVEPIDVFPLPEQSPLKVGVVGCLNEVKGLGSLSGQISLTEIREPSELDSVGCLAVVSPEALTENWELCRQATERGIGIYCQEQEKRTHWKFPYGHEVEVIHNADRGEHIWQRLLGVDYSNFNRDHPATRDFQAGDFAYWYDEERGERNFITLHKLVCESYKATPVLTSSIYPIVAELRIHQSRVVVSEVVTRGRAGSHPILTEFLIRMLHDLAG